MAGRVSRLNSIAPQFVVADVVEAAEYYPDVPGFKILGYFADPPVFATVRRDVAEIHFGKSDEGRPAPDSQHRRAGVDAYVRVDNVTKPLEELTESGAAILEGPVRRCYGCLEIVVRDPFGFLIAFGE